MIKLAYNKENPNLVFEINSIDRVAVGNAGIKEEYVGTLVNTSTVPDTRTEGHREQVSAFEMKWNEVPIDLGSTGNINNQSKTVDPAATKVVVTPSTGYTGLDKVTVNAAALETTSVTPTTEEVTVTPGEGKIGLSAVTVNAAPLETASVTPTTSEQTVAATGTGKIGLSSVTVAAVTSAIDANIVPGNIKSGVTILGVEGTYEG